MTKMLMVMTKILEAAGGGSGAARVLGKQLMLVLTTCLVINYVLLVNYDPNGDFNCSVQHPMMFGPWK
jgi:hypothetical protein